MKEKKEKKVAEKVTIKADKAIAAYNVLNTQKNAQTGKEGFKLSALETKDIFIVLRAINALKPIATAFEGFQKDAQEKLRPENWEEVVEKSQKFKDLSDEEKIAVNKAVMDYNGNVSECIASELEKEKEVDAYERLTEEGFGLLVRENGHLLDVPSIVLLQEVLA